jgi:serine/threonine protein phosphatase PrpC
LYLKAPSTDEMRRWLFCFQKSVALVISGLITSSSQIKFLDRQNSINPYFDQDVRHRHNESRERRNSSTDMSIMRYESEQDTELIHNKSFHSVNSIDNKGMPGNLSQSFSQHSHGWIGNSKQGEKTNLESRVFGISRSPAIPIASNFGDRLSIEKVSGSYVDSPLDGRVVLEEAMNGLALERQPIYNDNYYDDDTSDNDNFNGDDSSDNDSNFSDNNNNNDMMFGFEDEDTKKESNLNKNLKSKSSRNSESTSSYSGGSRRNSEHIIKNISKEKFEWTSGSCSKLGVREKQEDRCVSINDLNDVVTSINGVDRHAFFAVYDGHAGDKASIHCSNMLHLAICNHPLYSSNLEEAISEICNQTDKDFVDYCRENGKYDGTTALGVFIRNSKLTVFNIGDCQAVMCTDGIAIDMNTTHKPGRPDESERIIQAGGWITEEKELYMGRLHRMDLSDPVVRDKAEKVNWTTIHRVCGELAVSRSIGDPDYKSFIPGEKVSDPFFIWPKDHDGIFHADLVIPQPEFKSVELTKKDEFLIIASDGLWDVLTPKEAVIKTKELLNLGKSTTIICEELVGLAIKLGSSDNVTIVIVQFHHRTIN